MICFAHNTATTTHITTTMSLFYYISAFSTQYRINSIIAQTGLNSLKASVIYSNKSLENIRLYLNAAKVKAPCIKGHSRTWLAPR